MERKLGYSELIPLENISREFPYCLRFEEGDSRLEASLEAEGILFPLLLFPAGGPAPILVSGHKRFFYALRRGWSEVPAVLIEEKLSPKELFLLSLYSNWNQAFSELDRMEAIRKAERAFGLSPDEIRDEVLPALGLSPTRAVLEDYRRVGKLCRPIHSLIQAGTLPFRGSSQLDRFPLEEQTFLARSVLNQVHLTTNQLLLLAEWLLDLKRIQNTSLEKLFRESLVQKIFENSHLNSRARGEKFFEAIRSLRFPRLSEEARSFASLKHELEEMEEVHLERPEGPESEAILLRARLKDCGSLARVLRLLETHRPSLETYLEHRG